MNKNSVIGIDLGGTKISAGTVNEEKISKKYFGKNKFCNGSVEEVLKTCLHYRSVNE